MPLLEEVGSVLSTVACFENGKCSCSTACRVLSMGNSIICNIATACQGSSCCMYAAAVCAFGLVGFK